MSPQKVISHIQKPYYIFAQCILNYYWFQKFSPLSILQQASYFLVISDLVALVQSSWGIIVILLSDLPKFSGTAAICTLYMRNLLNQNFLLHVKVGGVYRIGVQTEIKPSMRTFLNIQNQDVCQTWIFPKIQMFEFAVNNDGFAVNFTLGIGHICEYFNIKVNLHNLTGKV